jgi:hypothetical protein
LNLLEILFYICLRIKTNAMTQVELRIKVATMTSQEFIGYRDELESNWSEVKRPLMQILSLACINRFGMTLVGLEQNESKTT